MNRNKATKGKFKSKGASILKAKKSGPDSMTEFLEDPTSQKTAGQSSAGPDAQNHNNAIAQTHTSAKAKTHKTHANNTTEALESNQPTPENIERLHVHIRKDLADELLEMVFKRKCDRKMKKKEATQRVIIEEALEEYFSNHPKQSKKEHKSVNPQ